MESPVGRLTLYGTAEALLAIVFPRHSRETAEVWVRRVTGQAVIVDDARPHLAALAQLAEYFDGRRLEFQLALDVRGTPFQVRVWRAVAAVPYGQTRSYKDIARIVGAPSATRAVGAANGANPLPIIIPCHRIIGADGGLHGYGGGLDVKERLLALERAHAAPAVP